MLQAEAFHMLLTVLTAFASGPPRPGELQAAPSLRKHVQAFARSCENLLACVVLMLKPKATCQESWLMSPAAKPALTQPNQFKDNPWRASGVS